MTLRDFRSLPLVLLSLVTTTTLAATTPTGDDGLSPDLSENIHQLQASLIEDEVTGSNVVLVFKDGREIFSSVKNSGTQGDRDITEETLFPIWSMSKPITIVAMLILHEQGLFKWDDPVSKYIPCFADLTVKDGDTTRPAKTPLRVIDLMTHRSGYTYYPMVSGIPSTHDQPQQSQTTFANLQEFCEVAAAYPLEFDPGTDYIYGINQAILGRLVEVLSGRPFATYLQEAIFTPLEMTETSFVLDADRRARFHPLFINSGDLKGYTFLLDELNYDPASKAHFGGEGLVSCLADYARFCEMLLHDGEFRGTRIISKASLAEMVKVRNDDILPGFMPGMDMGFSVFVLSDPVANGSNAPAGIFGWSGYHNTHFWIDPENNLFAIFMSRSREFNSGIPQRLRAAIYGPNPSPEPDPG